MRAAALLRAAARCCALPLPLRCGGLRRGCCGRGGGRAVRGARAGTMAASPWAKEVRQVEKELGTSLRSGLSAGAVAKKRDKHGWNELEKEEGTTFWAMVLEQFDDPLVRVLLLAAVVSASIAVHEVYEAGHTFQLSHFVEPLVILTILVLNAMVGVYQESSAEKSLEALKEMQPDTCRALRDGAFSTLAARELVPGDVVELRVGDRVPADCRVGELKTTTLRLEQMALTGESVSVSKQSEPVAQLECEIQAKASMMFGGTTLANGNCLAIVTATGMHTEIGKIQAQLVAAAEETAEEKTPLKQKLEEFSDQLQNIISVICLSVWLINFRMFVDTSVWPWQLDVKKAIYYFQVAVALAVAAVPEGLPTVITMCLALGTRKMARRNAIVRKLPAVETLGCTSVICSDKTGTLTTNQMSCTMVVTCGASDADLVRAEVSGSTYDPSDGHVAVRAVSASLKKLAQIMALCNDSTVERNDKGKFKHVGAPTEAALTVLVEKLFGGQPAKGSVTPHSDRLLAESHKVATLEFTRDRKSMSVIVSDGAAHAASNGNGGGGSSSAAPTPVRTTRSSARSSGSGSGGRASSGGGSSSSSSSSSGSGGGSNELLVKGAPEQLLSRCTSFMAADGTRGALSNKGREAIMREMDAMAAKAWRCLGFAFSDALGPLADYDGPHHASAARLTNTANFSQVESGLCWVGIVAMQDPPRKEVRGAMVACRKAGVRVIVITGDNKLTAEAICRDIGVFDARESLEGKSFVGHDFSKLSKAEQSAVLLRDRTAGLVFSRAEPKFKQDIVKLLKEAGDVVAMTGDGVNDAPALKMADIGIAMGITGTEVAKEASDFVLADDNFNTIVGAVEEGRSIYANMRAFIRYMISSNVGEVMSIFFVAALGLPEGMVPVQLLWVNLVTDGPPATALGFNRADPDIMDRPPRDRNETLISWWVLVRFIVIGIYVGFATVGAFVTWYAHGVGSEPFLGFLDLSKDGHSSVSLWQLRNWHNCNPHTNLFALDGKNTTFTSRPWTAGGIEYNSAGGCAFFGVEGKMKASTLSLSVLVSIEMFNALNALSENGSLLVVPPWDNLYLLGAMAGSFFLHGLILYVPSFSPLFDVVPLSFDEWALVILYALPVILIDEVLKLLGRIYERGQKNTREAQREAALTGADKQSKKKK